MSKKFVCFVICMLVCLASLAGEVSREAGSMIKAIMAHPQDVYTWAAKNLDEKQMASFKLMLLPPASDQRVQQELSAIRARLKALNVDTPEVAAVTDVLDKNIATLTK